MSLIRNGDDNNGVGVGAGFNVYDAIENEERVGEKAGKAEKYEHMQGSNEREKKNGAQFLKLIVR